MADQVLFEGGDDLSESNLGLAFGHPLLTDYVLRGISSSIDFGNNTVDYTQGELVVTDSNDRGYVLSADARTGLSLTDSATNHVFVEYDPTTDDSITFTINTTGTSPTDPHIKIEEIDTSADTSTEFNRNPTATGISTQADTGTITASGGSTPAADATATNVSINQDSDYWVILYVDADPSFSADYKWNWEYSHNWDDTNSEVDLDFTVTWDTDPGAGNDVTLRWEVRQP